MADAGVRTTDFAAEALLDEVLGNRDGGTARATVDQLATQMVASGPLGQKLDTVDGQIDDLQTAKDSQEMRLTSAEGAIASLEQTAATGRHDARLGPVACATTANIALTGVVVVDAISSDSAEAQAKGILVMHQTAPSQNGIYLPNNGGAWSRRSDMNAAGEFQGTAVYVTSGTTNGARQYVCQGAVTTIGTDPVTFGEVLDLNALVAGKADQAALTAGLAQKADLALMKGRDADLLRGVVYTLPVSVTLSGKNVAAGGITSSFDEVRLYEFTKGVDYLVDYQALDGSFDRGVALLDASQNFIAYLVDFGAPSQSSSGLVSNIAITKDTLVALGGASYESAAYIAFNYYSTRVATLTVKRRASNYTVDLAKKADITLAKSLDADLFRGTVYTLPVVAVEAGVTFTAAGKGATGGSFIWYYDFAKGMDFLFDYQAISGGFDRGLALFDSSKGFLGYLNPGFPGGTSSGLVTDILVPAASLKAAAGASYESAAYIGVNYTSNRVATVTAKRRASNYLVDLAKKSEAFSPVKKLFDGALDPAVFYQVFGKAGYVDETGTQVENYGTNSMTPFMACWEGVTFTADNMESNKGAGANGYLWAAFFDANFTPLTPTVGTGLVNAPNYNVTSGLSVSAPANTAWCILSNYYRSNIYGQFGLKWDAAGMKWHSDVLRKYLDGERTISVHGDSIASSFAACLDPRNDRTVQTRILENNAIGGESVLDSCFRAGLVPLIFKGPITLPADGSAVTVPAVWKFREKRVLDPTTGAYTINGPTHSASAEAAYPAFCDYNGVRIQLHKSGPNPTPTWTLQLVTPQAQPFVIPGDFEAAQVAYLGKEQKQFRKPVNIGIVMMATNGGFSSAENAYFASDPDGDVDRLLNLQQIMDQAFFGKCILVGNWVGGLAGTGGGPPQKQLDYEAAMQRAFGARFFNGRMYLITEAVKRLGMVITAGELARMNNGLPPQCMIPGLTHTTTFANRAIMNSIFHLIEQHGWIDRHYPLSNPLPDTLSLASSAGLELSVGGTTTLTITSPTAGLYGGALSAPIITTSDPAVISLPDVSASALSGSDLSIPVTLTAAGAGTATVTVQARFGGVTQTIDFTVS